MTILISTFECMHKGIKNGSSWMDCRTFEIFQIQWSSTVGHEHSFKIVVSSIVGHLKYSKFNVVLLLIMKIIKEFIQEFIGVLLSRSGVLLSCWSSFVGYF
jgi:hypothetical protein